MKFQKFELAAVFMRMGFKKVKKEIDTVSNKSPQIYCLRGLLYITE